MRRARTRPYRVGDAHRNTTFQDRFRYPHGHVKRIWVEIFDQNLNRFILTPVEGDAVLVPGEAVFVPAEAKLAL